MAKRKGDGDGWLLLLLGAAGVGLIAQENQKNELRANLALEQQRRMRAEQNHLNLLKEFMRRVNELPQDTKQQLIEIHAHYKGIDENIAAELQTILDLLDAGKIPIAIEKLVKIIENILKEKFVAEKKATAKEKCPSLFEMVKQAFIFHWISKREYKFIDLIRDPRNEEAHNLNVSYSKNEAMIYILAGIEILHTFKGVKKQHV